MELLPPQEDGPPAGRSPPPPALVSPTKPSNVDPPRPVTAAAEAAEALTEATARVKEEVIATAEEQTRVMEKATKKAQSGEAGKQPAYKRRLRLGAQDDVCGLEAGKREDKG